MSGEDKLHDLSHQSQSIGATGSKKKNASKRAQSKDAKILQTMKAYMPSMKDGANLKKIFPNIASSGQKAPIPAPRSTTTNNQKIGGKHSERIIFVESRRKVAEPDSSASTKFGRQNSFERRNSQANNSVGMITIQQKPHEQIKRNTQLPPINRRGQPQVQVLDQQQDEGGSNFTNSNQILSPISTNQQYQMNDNLDQQQQIWSDKKKSMKLLYTNTDQDLYIAAGGLIDPNFESEQQQNKIDYHRKNQELIKQMQEKKNQEALIIENERRKLQKKQEKLKQMILREAAEVKKRKKL